MERERVDTGMREGRVLKYDGLKARMVGEGKGQRRVDMIVCPPFLLPAAPIQPPQIWERGGRVTEIRADEGRKLYLMVTRENLSWGTRMVNRMK